MSNTVDLVAVMEARTELARLAAEHPEAFHPDRLQLLTDNLEQHLMTPAKTRMQQYRDKVKAQGKKRVTLTLTPEAAAALETLKAAGYGADYNTVVSRALLTLAISKVAPALVDRGE